MIEENQKEETRKLLGNCHKILSLAWPESRRAKIRKSWGRKVIAAAAACSQYYQPVSLLCSHATQTQHREDTKDMEKPKEGSQVEEEQFILAEGPRYDTEAEQETSTTNPIAQFNLAPVLEQIKEIRTFLAASTRGLNCPTFYWIPHELFSGK